MEAPPRVPGFRLLRQIGQGRRSTAWLAWDLTRKTDVVLKLEPFPGPSLQRECVVAARVQSPHLVRMHGHGRTTQWSFIAMEHVPGGDLARRMRAPIDRGQALDLAAQAARALAQLHRQKLVHRDVKPANFLLRADGTLVLADFGLAVEAGTVDPASARAPWSAPRATWRPSSCRARRRRRRPMSIRWGCCCTSCCRPPAFSGRDADGDLLPATPRHARAAARSPGEPAAAGGPDALQSAHCRLPDADAVLGLIGQRC